MPLTVSTTIYFNSWSTAYRIQTNEMLARSKGAGQSEGCSCVHSRVSNYPKETNLPSFASSPATREEEKYIVKNHPPTP